MSMHDHPPGRGATRFDRLVVPDPLPELQRAVRAAAGRIVLGRLLWPVIRDAMPMLPALFGSKPADRSMDGGPVRPDHKPAPERWREE